MRWKESKTPPGRVRLTDVAARAKVSTATVSLILSERERYLKQFHPDTVRRVRQTAQSLGYCSNLFASGLPTNSLPFFAFVVRDAATASEHQRVLEGELIGGAAQAAAVAGLYPVLTAVSDCQDLSTALRIIDGGVMGAVVQSPDPPLEKLLRARIRQGKRIVILFPRRPSAWHTNAITVTEACASRSAAELHEARRAGAEAVRALAEMARSGKISFPTIRIQPAAAAEETCLAVP